MRFFFIRHAQSTNNFLYDSTGASTGRSSDPEVTPIGRQQIEILARFLRTGNPSWRKANNGQSGFGITHLYTSLMVRAIETGSGIANELGLPLVAWEDLHETGGIYLDDVATGTRIGQAGKNRADFANRFRKLVLPESLGDAGWWNRPYEEREQRSARAQRVVDELLRRHGGTDDCVAVVSHGGFYNRILRALLRIEHEDCWFGMYNCGITRIDFSPDTVDLVYMNRLDFMPSELVT